jgi:hypothetical protein
MLPMWRFCDKRPGDQASREQRSLLPYFVSVFGYFGLRSKFWTLLMLHRFFQIWLREDFACNLDLLPQRCRPLPKVLLQICPYWAETVCLFLWMNLSSWSSWFGRSSKVSFAWIILAEIILVAWVGCKFGSGLSELFSS